MEQSHRVLKELFDCECLSLNVDNPFTYASGLKGPLYCDNRKIMGFLNSRRVVMNELTELVKTFDVQFDVLAGLATAGIAPAAWVSEQLSLPMAYIRSGAKSHGKQNKIEGVIEREQKVLLVEDLVNQASSLESAVLSAREFSDQVNHCVSIVDYQMDAAQERLERLEVELKSLVRFEDLCNYASSTQLLTEQQVEELQKWQRDPKVWGEAR